MGLSGWGVGEGGLKGDFHHFSLPVGAGLSLLTRGSHRLEATRRDKSAATIAAPQADTRTRGFVCAESGPKHTPQMGPDRRIVEGSGGKLAWNGEPSAAAARMVAAVVGFVGCIPPSSTRW